MTSKSSVDFNHETQLMIAGEKPLEAIGNYALVRLLGEGAMGSVYLAYHRQFVQRFYAVKLLKGEKPPPETVQRFEREIQVTGSLRHPNLIYAQDAGVTPAGHLYLVMEYVSGIDLQKLLAVRGRLSFADATALLCQACEGIAHAHAEGIIHRDIKPSNLLVDRDGLLKVSDLGLAAIADQESNLMATSAQSVLGTPHFMAPELWEDARRASPASDVYALGCTFYALIAGAPPFAHRQTTASLIRAHETEPPSFLADCWKGVHGLVVDRIGKCLDKDPDKRMESAETLRLELLQFAATKVSVTEEIAAAEGRDLTTVNSQAMATERREGGRRRPTAMPQPAAAVNQAAALNWSINAYTKPKIGRITLVLAVMLVVSLISLTMAYYGPGATEAWRRRYDLLNDTQPSWGAGYAIEAARALIFLTLSCFVLSHRFTRELNAAFDWQRWNWELTVGRLGVFAMLALFLGAEIVHHVDPQRAPAELAAWAQEHGIETTPQREAFSYRWYLGYCLTNYLVILGGLIALPCARFVTFDAAYAWKQRAKLREQFRHLTSASEIGKALLRFGVQCRELASRYVDVLATLVVGIHFDWWIGWQTLSESGLLVLISGWIVVAMGCSFLLVLTWIYTRAHDDAAKLVARFGGITEEAEIARLSPAWFLRRLLFGSLGGLVCLTIWFVLLHSVLRR